MVELLEYKCPHCGGAVRFDGETQTVKCPFCDSEFAPEQFEEMVFDTSAGTEWSEGEASGMVSYVCHSCGGEIVCESGTAATGCPYCDNPVVVAGNVSGSLRPDLIIPFKLDKKQAKAAFSSYLCGKRLLPNVFKSENHIDEIKGIYVPLWMFDASVDATANFTATRLNSWSDAKYNYLDTQRYNVTRGGHLDFDNVPAPGTSKIDRELLEAIEPYDTAQAQDFDASYLAGYYADRYDIPAEQCTEEVDARIREGVVQLLTRSMSGFSSNTMQNLSIRGGKAKAKYVLYPVWLLTTRWNGKLYTYAMNGRTGQFAGELPLDKSKYWRWFGAIAAICAVAIYVFARLLSC